MRQEDVRKKPDTRAQYATFNRRMIAATVDSLLVMLLVAPAIDMIFNHLHGPVKLDLAGLHERMVAHPETAGLLF
jgi:hypothetical protein